jgi:hypothetical protein
MISIAIRIAAITTFVLVAAASTGVHAATCTVQGTLQISPLDTYYCDSSILNCSGWNEVNLHGTKPLRNIRVGLRVGGVVVATTTTSSTGAFSVSWNGFTSCAGTNVEMITYFMRQNPGTSWQIFKIVDEDNLVHTYIDTWPWALTGTVSNYSYTISRSNYWLTYKRVANLYYTIDSALTEMRTWSTNLANRLGGSSSSQTITVEYYEGQNYDNAADLPWGIKLSYARWAWGANTRHELGHMVHMAAHHQKLRNFWSSCVSLRLNQPGVNLHGEESCEYTSLATWEGLASVFAVRSLVEGAGENGAFFCFGACANPASNQNFCSEAAASALEPDRNQFNPPCTGDYGWFTGVGDNFASGQAHCARVRADQGCNCPDANDDDICDWGITGTQWYVTNGHRNEANTYRFFWDILDSGNEGGFDDTDMNANSFVAGLEGMLCGTTGGIDGTCNETSPSTCNPSFDWIEPTTHVTGNRDSYNVHDLSEHAGIPGAQDGERLINCVHNAPDLD